MKPSVLISDPSGYFRIEQIDDGLEPLQKIVGGYIEAVSDPAGRWNLYCNEEGKLEGLAINRFSTRFVDEMLGDLGNLPFSAFDVLVGTIAWLGPAVSIGDDDEHSFPLDLVNRFATTVLSMTPPDRPITVVRQGRDLWVYDNPLSGPAERISACVERARLAVADGAEHGTIEVLPALSPGRWTEIRVEIMDDYTIIVHDHREDRSYG